MHATLLSEFCYHGQSHYVTFSDLNNILPLPAPYLVFLFYMVMIS